MKSLRDEFQTCEKNRFLMPKIIPRMFMLWGFWSFLRSCGGGFLGFFLRFLLFSFGFHGCNIDGSAFFKFLQLVFGERRRYGRKNDITLVDNLNSGREL